MARAGEYESAERSADPCQKVLDKYFGNVKCFANGVLPVAIWHAGCLIRLAPNCSKSVQPRTQVATENQHYNMQNYCKTIGALAAASALVAGNASAGTSAPAPVTASAPESSISYELHAGYSSEYLFRGLDLGNSLVETGIDVAGEAFGLGLSAGAWYGSFDTRPSYDIDELDLYAEVSKDLGFLTAAVGYIYYFNEDLFSLVQDSQEVYFSVARDFGFVNASLTYFWDIETDNDGYSEFALDRSFDLSPCLALKVATNVGFFVEESDFSAWTTKVALDWSFVEHAKLSPFVALSIALSDDEKTSYDNELVGGSMLSVSF